MLGLISSCSIVLVIRVIEMMCNQIVSNYNALVLLIGWLYCISFDTYLFPKVNNQFLACPQFLAQNYLHPIGRGYFRRNSSNWVKFLWCSFLPSTVYNKTHSAFVTEKESFLLPNLKSQNNVEPGTQKTGQNTDLSQK